MDLYEITQAIGKDPTKRHNRITVSHLLKRYNIQPERRGWYESSQAAAFIARYQANQKHTPKQYKTPST